MSAYSDWKCGALGYDEMRQEMAFEARRDEYYEREKEYEDENEEEEDEWIPVSERLPEEGQEVRIQMNNGYITAITYSTVGVHDHIVAWMPRKENK